MFTIIVLFINVAVKTDLIVLSLEKIKMAQFYIIPMIVFLRLQFGQ